MTPEERTAAGIVLAVAQEHGLEARCLRYEMPHSRRYARPRGEAARRLKAAFGWSDLEIGRYFGGFDRSTILSCRRPTYEPKKPGPKPPTPENLLRQLWDLRRRVEWLEQRAGLPPIKVGQKRRDADVMERAGLPLITKEDL